MEKKIVEKILELIKQEIGENVNVDELDSTTSLEDQDVDSLDRLSIFLAVEEFYDISIPDNDYTGLKTINEIAKYVREHT